MDIWNWLISDSFFNIFAKDMRTGMFSGFLTVGGFLYSAHTFIVVHMKKEVYETPEYRQRIRDNRRAKPSVTFFGPLKNLSRLLIASTVSALLTSSFQFTIGLFPYNLTALLCVAMALITMLLLASSIAVMIINFRGWFDSLEKQAEAISATDEKTLR